MKNLTCPNCQANLEFNLINLKGTTNINNQHYRHPNSHEESPVYYGDARGAHQENEIAGFKQDHPIGVDCQESDCKGKLLVRKGKWGFFVGCSYYEIEQCEGSLSFPCPSQDCNGLLKVKQKRDGSNLFLGCNQYQENNCREGMSFLKAIQKANTLAKEDNKNSNTNKPTAPQVAEAIQQNKMVPIEKDEIPF